MTEAEWLECEDPRPMLEFVRRRVSERKRRLFVCASARRSLHLASDLRTRRALEVAESYADGLVGKSELQQARAQAEEADIGFPGAGGGKCGYAHGAVREAALVRLDAGGLYAAGLASLALAEAGTCSREEEQRCQCDLLRCLLENPFRPATFNPAWRTPTITALAEAASSERQLPSGELDPQ